MKRAPRRPASLQGVKETTRATPRTLSIKNEFIFTYESRGTLKSFTLFITVKTITKPNLEHSDNLEIEI